MTAPVPVRRLPAWSPVAALAGLCYLPLLLTHRGQVGADTKSYLYIDPSRMLGRAWSMWDPNVGMGTVPHQNIGYLWPMGPYYWLCEAVGLPDWMAQRLWLGSILFVAGLGVRYLLRTLGQEGIGVSVAMVVYALTPYVLTLGARISALLLPFAALGWLLGLTVRSLRERSWRHPALFALAVATCGSVNATALLLVGLAPALWIPYATFVLREVRLRQALAVVARMGVLTVGVSLWWIAGLSVQGGYGIDVLRYTETARTVANASVAPEVFRGLGYWFFYGDDKFGPWIEPSPAYTQNPLLIAVTYALPLCGLLAAALVRWRHRSYFVGLVALGAVIAIGAHPWNDPALVGEGFKAFLQLQVGLAMRSLPRAVPLLALGLAVLTGVGVNALQVRTRSLQRPAGWALVALAIVGLPPLWLGQMVGDNLQRDEDLPRYWLDAAADLDARGWDGATWRSRVLEVPGTDFASYRWGNTVDPITPGLIDRPFVARELIPYGTPASAELLNALDRQMQEAVLDPAALAPVARLMGVGDILLRSDLAYERYSLLRPRQAYALLEGAPGLGTVAGYGGDDPNVPDPRLPLEDELELGADPDLPDPPKVAIFPVTGDPAMVAAKPGSATVLLAGNAEGILAAAAAGLVDGDELLRYAASFAADGGGGAAALRDTADSDVPLVLTDTNRRAGRRWGTVHETDGYTETADEEALEEDPSDNRLPVFPGASADSQTVAVHAGGVTARATGYGNEVSFTPEDRAAGAVDDDPRTAWYVSAFSSAVGERLVLDYDQPRTTDRIRLVQATRGIQNRWIRDVRLRFDDGSTVEAALGPASRTPEGQWIDFPRRTFDQVTIEVRSTDPGQRDTYNDLSGVGFADVRLGDGDVRLDEIARLPVDLLDALGEASLDHPLAIVLTRLRTRPSVALRSDEEVTVVREVDLPTARSFALAGTARLSALAPELLIDALVGLPSLADGGVETASSRRLPGDITAGATAAADGDPGTHWSPGYLGQEREWASYRLAESLTFDHMDLQLVTDGRHTVPTRLRIVADGQPAGTVDVPALADEEEKDATTTVRVDLPAPVTGRHIEIHIDDTREVTTNDWLSQAPVVMPVGIAEWGIPGLDVAAPPERFDTGCRDDLLTVDGDPVPVRITGATADALSGEALDLLSCDGHALELPAGTTVLRTADGAGTGIQVDALTLRSAAGGEPEAATGPLVPDADGVSARVTASGRWHSTVAVGPRDEPTWLVIGQSHSDGWHATVDGEDLGAPQLVDGYSSAFLLPPGTDPLTVEVEWRPQRTVFVGLAGSALFGVGCGALALAPRRRRRKGSSRDDALDLRPEPDERPAPLDLAAVLDRPVGPPVGWPVAAGVAVGAALAGVAAVGPASGVVLAVLAVLALRTRRGPLLLALAPVVLLALPAAYIVVQQVRHGFEPGFFWPQRLTRVHGLAYTGIVALALSPLVDRLRRPTPTDTREASRP